LLNAGRPAEAARSAEAALAILPRYPDASLTLAKACRALASEERDPSRRQALHGRAVQLARTVAEHLTPGSGDPAAIADAWSTAGALALDEQDAAGAAEAFGRSLALTPDDAHALAGAGAAEMLRAARETDPSRRDEEEQAALRRFEQALSGNPAD